MSQRFAGRSVLVTGASMHDGIGASAARRFAAEGARVALTARSADGLEAVAKEITEQGGEARSFPADVRDLDACEKLIADVVEAYGGLDVLVNNAGFNARGNVADLDARELVNILQVNLVGPVALTALALPHLRKSYGAVVQVASIAGQLPLDGEAAYSASKVGLRFFSFALRDELEGTGTRVSVVSPGPVETGFIFENMDPVPDIVFAQPMSSADDIAAAVVEAAVDGRRERTIPAHTGVMARLGAQFPLLRKAVEPLMERKGRAVKARYRASRGA